MVVAVEVSEGGGRRMSGGGRQPISLKQRSRPNAELDLGTACNETVVWVDCLFTSGFYCAGPCDARFAGDIARSSTI